MDEYDLERKLDDLDRRISKLENNINTILKMVLYKEEMDKLRFGNKKPTTKK